MLFKPEDLSYGYDPIQEAADILNESVYLNESESILSPMAVPVVENARIGACVVAFDDVERLAEDHGVDYIDAMVGIAEANGIGMDHLAVSVPEWKIIADPEVVNELSNVIVAPISDQNPIYQFCEACVNMAIQEEDEGYIGLMMSELLIEARNVAEYNAEKEARQKEYEKNDPGSDTNMKAREGRLQYNIDHPNEENQRGMEAAKQHLAAVRAVNRSGGGNGSFSSLTSAGSDDKPVAKAKTLLDKVKDAAKWPVKKISQAISSLKKYYLKLKTKYQSIPEGKRTIWQKIMNAMISAIDKLSNLLSSKKAA